MFRKYITDLALSPTSIGEVALYAKELKREEKLRRLSAFLLIPAIVLQVLVLAYPPESNNTASRYDLVYGGTQNLENTLRAYNRNTAFFNDKLSALGITHEEIRALNPATIAYRDLDGAYLASDRPFAATNDTKALPYHTASQETPRTLYLNPAQAALPYKQQTHAALTGISHALGNFAILTDSGSVLLSSLPDLRYLATETDLIRSVTVHNDTQNAADATAQPSDRLTYTLTVENPTEDTIATTITHDVADIQEYADAVDAKDGQFNPENGLITWPNLELPAGETVQKRFSARLKPHLPATAQGQSNPHSFDCLMRSSFGESLFTPVACPLTKTVETASRELPNVQNNTVIALSALLFATILFYYVRSLQYKEEIRLIRRDANEGALL